MRNPGLKKTNRLGLLLLIVGLVLALILMSLPLYRFNAAVYIKKSPNTFVGDEKYLAVKEEVETVAKSYRAQGFDVQLDEDEYARYLARRNPACPYYEPGDESKIVRRQN